MIAIFLSFRHPVLRNHFVLNHKYCSGCIFQQYVDILTQQCLIICLLVLYYQYYNCVFGLSCINQKFMDQFNYCYLKGANKKRFDNDCRFFLSFKHLNTCPLFLPNMKRSHLDHNLEAIDMLVLPTSNFITQGTVFFINFLCGSLPLAASIL